MEHVYGNFSDVPLRSEGPLIFKKLTTESIETEEESVENWRYELVSASPTLFDKTSPLKTSLFASQDNPLDGMLDFTCSRLKTETPMKQNFTEPAL